GRVITEQSESLRNVYEMLSGAQDAPADEIKKAFRREIARYHPDKVQHLGQEFQEMAAGIAADLTEAYRILMDPTLRTKYDQDLLGDAIADKPASQAPRPKAPDAPPPPPSSSSSSTTASAPSSAWSSPQAPPRPSPLAGVDFVKKASLPRMRDAVDEVMGNDDPAPVTGFDL